MVRAAGSSSLRAAAPSPAPALAVGSPRLGWTALLTSVTGGSREGMRGSRGAGRALGGSSSSPGRIGPETARKAGKAEAAGSRTKGLGIAGGPMIRAGESLVGRVVQGSLPDPVPMTLRAMAAATLAAVEIHPVVGLMTLADHHQICEVAEDLMISREAMAEVVGAMEVAASPMAMVPVTDGALHSREGVVVIVGALALVKTDLDSRTGLVSWTDLDSKTGQDCRTLEMVAGQEGGGQKGAARMIAGQAVEDQMVEAKMTAGAHVGKMGLPLGEIETVIVIATAVVTGREVGETETGIRTEREIETGTETEAAEIGTKMSHASGAENPSGTTRRMREGPRLRVTLASTQQPSNRSQGQAQGSEVRVRPLLLSSQTSNSSITIVRASTSLQRVRGMSTQTPSLPGA